MIPQDEEFAEMVTCIRPLLRDADSMEQKKKGKKIMIDVKNRMRIARTCYGECKAGEAIAVAFGDWENLQIGDEIPHNDENCEIPCIQLLDLIWFDPANLAYFKPSGVWFRPDELVEVAIDSFGENTNAGHAYIIVGRDTLVSTESRDTYIQNGRVIAKMW